MRINKYVALSTGMSRRQADEAIKVGKVLVNGRPASLSQQVSNEDGVKLDGNVLQLPTELTTIMLHKPVGYVSSRAGQGSRTIYDLLPPEYHDLKPVGRLDKDSSGLLLLTNDGQLAQALTHPSFNKEKVYEVTLNKALAEHDQSKLDRGVQLEDGLSKLKVKSLGKAAYRVTMSEGRNRQIRRTFDVLGYSVQRLHRKSFGDYTLDDLPDGRYKSV